MTGWQMERHSSFPGHLSFLSLDLNLFARYEWVEGRDTFIIIINSYNHVTELTDVSL